MVTKAGEYDIQVGAVFYRGTTLSGIHVGPDDVEVDVLLGEQRGGCREEQEQRHEQHEQPRPVGGVRQAGLRGHDEPPAMLGRTPGWPA